MTEKARIIVFCEGGLVQGISADRECEILVVDFDANETSTPDNLVHTLTDRDGKSVEAWSLMSQPDIEPVEVDRWFAQVSASFIAKTKEL